MTSPERKSEGSPIKIYPWSISVTGGFNERELRFLRIFPVKYLIEDFDENPYSITRALVEIVFHGNPRRAAQFARGLVELNPDHLERFREYFEGYEQEMEVLFKKPIDEFPSQPSEIRGPIEYVQ